MENYQNSNGQFGGWEQNRVPYGAQYQQGFVPYGGVMPEQKQEEQNDKNILKKMGNCFGIAIILYVVLSTVFSLAILLL